MRRSSAIMLSVALVLASATIALAQGNEEEARKYLVRGMAAIEMAKSGSDLAKAAVEFKKAAEIAPGMAEAWYNLGSVQVKTGQIKEALESYRKYLALAPQADDARRIGDEIIKLEYRLEQAEQFRSLSGYWLSDDGQYFLIKAADGKLSLEGRHYASPNAIDYSFDGQRETYAATLNYLVLNLARRGDKWYGSWDVPEYSFPTACAIPAHKAEVEAEVNEGAGRITLKITRPKYRVDVGFDFWASRCRCDGVSESGMLNEQEVLSGPLPACIIGFDHYVNASGNVSVDKIVNDNARLAGLRVGDEIISIDGAELSQIKTSGEKIRKLWGQPGSTVQLVVMRKGEKSGMFSSPKVEKIDVTLRRM